MVLRLEAEELTQYTDDLDAEAKRELLAAMLQSVDAVLIFFRGVSHRSSRCHAACTAVWPWAPPLILHLAFLPAIKARMLQGGYHLG